MKHSPSTLIMGIGNKYRGDDGVGLVAVQRLREQGLDCPIVESSGELTELLDYWERAERVVIVDAMASASAPGTILSFSAEKAPLPAESFHCSTHAVSLHEAVELARTMGRLPQALVIYGIEGKNFAAGEGLSPEVLGAVEEVVRRILKEIM